jgi:hypothetical protein
MADVVVVMDRAELTEEVMSYISSKTSDVALLEIIGLIVKRCDRSILTEAINKTILPKRTNPNVTDLVAGVTSVTVQYK